MRLTARIFKLSRDLSF